MQFLVMVVNPLTATCATGATFATINCTEMLQTPVLVTVEIALTSLCTKKILSYTDTGISYP